MKNRHFALIVYLTFIIFACNPEDELKNPANYELYISISSDQTPTVSPSGENIAYFHQCLEYPEPEDYPTGLYIMNIDGGNRKLLLKGNHREPSWSPDGNWLVFSSGGTLQIINLQGDSIRTFQGVDDLPLFWPDWSNDGETIIFSAPLGNEGGVFTMNDRFNNVINIFESPENNGKYASYSPDNNNIVYEKGNQSFSSVEIFTLNLISGKETRLTNDNKDDRHSTWSPTGELIAWSSNVQINHMSTDGGNRKRLDYGQYPSWTPDGKKIIYSNANQDFTKEVLWSIDINGENKSQITY